MDDIPITPAIGRSLEEIERKPIYVAFPFGERPSEEVVLLCQLGLLDSNEWGAGGQADVYFLSEKGKRMSQELVVKRTY